jgi:hypothetical protein
MKRVILVAAILAVNATAVLILRPPAGEDGGESTWRSTTAHYVCRVCGSQRVTYTAVVDDWETQTSNKVDPSSARSDLLGDRYEHDWALRYANTHHSDGTRVHGDGFPRFGRMPNRFVSRYNEIPEFRAFVMQCLQSGDLSLELAAATVRASEEEIDGASPAAVKARKLLAEFFGPR